MKEHPILMSAPMVRALLDGSKTQTRRSMKPQPPADECIGVGLYHPSVIDRRGEQTPGDETFGAYTTDGEWALPCLYGAPGDLLWVRESFWGCDLPGYGDQPCVVYDDEWYGKEYKPAADRPWARKFGRIPSIHMPRESSRITLEIVSVRVERLQGISEADAITEGIERRIFGNDPCQWRVYGQPDTFTSCPVKSYESLWESINGAGSWAANPFVWAIEFRRLP